LQDYELIAQALSGLGEKVNALDKKISGIERRMAEVERVNARLEDAALTTARALEEISGHWDAVYEAMRRTNSSQEAPEE
jgi:prefoldin subunit 5